MISRQFIKTESIDEAVSLLATHKKDCALIAGGTDLMVELHKENAGANILIDISRLEDLKYIREEPGAVRIGAGMTHAECIKSGVIKKYAPILADACSWVGSLQIRNRGTIGGNIISAAACADTVPALVVLNGKCLLKSARGTRELEISELITGANETIRKHDEICTEIVVDKMPEGAGYKFIKLIRRNSVAKSRLTVAVVARQDKTKIVTDIRISVGSTTPKPRRFKSAEELLLGKVPTEALFRNAGEKVSAEMIAVTGYRWSTEYKKPVAQALTARALREVLEV
jgi:CO/xanthine dehydrogenase FAD-binding subunit